LGVRFPVRARTESRWVIIGMERASGQPRSGPRRGSDWAAEGLVKVVASWWGWFGREKVVGVDSDDSKCMG
jgi:hypothetical protein